MRRLLGAMIGLFIVILGVACGSSDRTSGQGQERQENTVAVQATTDVPVLASAGIGTATSTASVPTPPATNEALCNSTIDILFHRFDTVEELAWTSHQVIVGTVIEEVGAEWRIPNPTVDSTVRNVVTEYLVRVDHRLRGVADATLHVRQLGGTLDGCTQTNDSEPRLRIGERLLLFLRDTQSSPLDDFNPSYEIWGGPQGYWEVSPDEKVSVHITHLQSYDGMPLEEFMQRILMSLSGSPPATPGLEQLVVPVEQAPVVTATAVP